MFIMNMFIIILSFFNFAREFFKPEFKRIKAMTYISPMIDIIYLVFLTFYFTNSLTSALKSSPSTWKIIFLLIIVASWCLVMYRAISVLISIYKSNKSEYVIYIIRSIVFIILSFAIIYSYIDFFDSQSFHGVNINDPNEKSIDFIYFSFTTFTTIGYGDIYPVAWYAKIAVIFEMVVFYLVLGTGITYFINSKRSAESVKSAENTVNGENAENTESTKGTKGTKETKSARISNSTKSTKTPEIKK